MKVLVLLLCCFALTGCPYLDALMGKGDVNYSAQFVEWPETVNPDCPSMGGEFELWDDLTLPAGCEYSRVTIYPVRSGITIDCNGAVFNGLDGRESRKGWGEAYTVPPTERALLVKNSEHQPVLRNITIRNCTFVNYVKPVAVSFGVSRASVERLRAGDVDEHQRLGQLSPQNIRFENVKIINAHGDGFYCQLYVRGCHLANVTIAGAGAVGAYFDRDGSKHSVLDSHFHGNGFSYWDSARKSSRARVSKGAKREAIALDAVSNVLVARNTFTGGADGAVFLYRNCGEGKSKPNGWLPFGGANDNQIIDNTISDTTVGVHVAAREYRDLSGFDCVANRETDGTWPDVALRNLVEGLRCEGVGRCLVDDDVTGSTRVIR